MIAEWLQSCGVLRKASWSICQLVGLAPRSALHLHGQPAALCTRERFILCSNLLKLQVRVRSSTDGVAVFLVACRTKPYHTHKQRRQIMWPFGGTVRVKRRVVTSQDLFSYANAAALLRRCL